MEREKIQKHLLEDLEHKHPALATASSLLPSAKETPATRSPLLPASNVRHQVSSDDSGTPGDFRRLASEAYPTHDPEYPTLMIVTGLLLCAAFVFVIRRFTGKKAR